MNADQMQVSEAVSDFVEDRAPTRAQLAQLERQKREQERASLGRLGRFFDLFEFRDEVLYSATLRRRPKGLEECLTEPSWATLEKLDLSSAQLPALEGRAGAFFNSLPMLHTLEDLHPRLFPELPCPRITAISMPEVPVWRVAEMFPNLRRLEFTDHLRGPREFWGHPFVEGLEAVTLGALTWSEGVLTTRNGFINEACVSWIAHGPLLTRLELSEDELTARGEQYGIHEFLAAARRKGAEVILVPGTPQPEPSWNRRFS